MSMKIRTPQPTGIPGNPSPVRTPEGAPQRLNRLPPSAQGLSARVSTGPQGAAMGPRIQLPGKREPMAQMKINQAERLLNTGSLAQLLTGSSSHSTHAPVQLTGVRNPIGQMQVNFAQGILGAIAHAKHEASGPPQPPKPIFMQVASFIIKPMLQKLQPHTQPQTQGNGGFTQNNWTQNIPSDKRGQLRQGLEHAKTKLQHASTALPTTLPAPIRRPIAGALAAGIHGIEKLLSHLAKPSHGGAGPQPWPTQMHTLAPMQIPTPQQPAAPAAANSSAASSGPKPSVLAASASKPQQPASQPTASLSTGTQPTTASGAKPPAKPSVAQTTTQASATTPASQLVTATVTPPPQKPSVSATPSPGSQALARPTQQASSASVTQPARPRTESASASTSNAIVLSTTQPPQTPSFTVAPEALARPTQWGTGASATLPQQPTPSKIKIDTPPSSGAGQLVASSATPSHQKPLATAASGSQALTNTSATPSPQPARPRTENTSSAVTSGGGQLVTSNAIQPHQKPSVTAAQSSGSPAVALPKLTSMSREDARKALEKNTSPQERQALATEFFKGQKTNTDGLGAVEKKLSEKIDISGASRRDISVLLRPYKVHDENDKIT
jgi:hypothetical protein